MFQMGWSHQLAFFRRLHTYKMITMNDKECHFSMDPIMNYTCDLSPKFNIDTRNSHCWKEIHLPTHNFWVYPYIFGNIVVLKNFLLKKTVRCWGWCHIAMTPVTLSTFFHSYTVWKSLPQRLEILSEVLFQSKSKGPLFPPMPRFPPPKKKRPYYGIIIIHRHQLPS